MTDITVELTLAEDDALDLGLAEEDSLGLGIGENVVITTDPVYHGDYEFTPTQQTQTVSTSGYLLEQNIIINPIPSNYGLITWDGSTLTVS